MSTTTRSRPSRAALAAERDRLNIARLQAESHLEALLGKVRDAEKEQAALDADHIPAEQVRPYSDYFPAGTRGGAVRAGGHIRYHQAPTAEELAAAQDAAEEAQHDYAETVRRLEAAPPDPDPLKACREQGARYYAGRTFTLGPATYHPGEVVPNRDLEHLDGRRLAALVKARHLIDAHPFAAVEVNP